jgi:hypothetical protein
MTPYELRICSHPDRLGTDYVVEGESVTVYCAHLSVYPQTFDFDTVVLNRRFFGIGSKWLVIPHHADLPLPLLRMPKLLFKHTELLQNRLKDGQLP